MKRFLCHEKVIIRFISLYLSALVLFYLAWIISYYFLPEFIMKNFFVSAKMAKETISSSFFQELHHIFILNILGGIIIIGSNYILRVNDIPMGYPIPILWIIFYAILLGTNSFSFSLEQSMRPSLEVFQRSGLYEIMSYILLAAATYPISVNKTESFRKRTEAVPVSQRKLNMNEWIAVVISFLILLLANSYEVYMIMNL